MARPKPPMLTNSLIIRWARAHRRRTGVWPSHLSGKIPESPGDNWESIRYALREGRRGLPGGSSLARLLARYRRIPYVNPFAPRKRLTRAQIRDWARNHLRRTGRLPTVTSGVIPGADGLTWTAVDLALRGGYRGLRGGSSLREVLRKRPGTIRNVHRIPLTRTRILAWADAHRARTGQWPTSRSGAIREAPGETWGAVVSALKSGYRGLGRGGETLGRLLAKGRGVVLPPYRTSRLSVAQILAWADDHRARTGRWPKKTSGRVLAEPAEAWYAINSALYDGRRGLGGGSSLARLLAKHRGARHLHERPRLSHRQILRWADAFHRRTGKWPVRSSGIIPGSGGETWGSVYDAMFLGRRGLRRLTLAELLLEHRDVPSLAHRPKLYEEMILLWARAYARRYGEWPDRYSGRIEDAEGETWLNIDRALRRGLRGLAGGTSLHLLLRNRRRPAVLISAYRVR